MYTPNSLNDILFHNDIISDLKNFLKENEFPNFLFEGKSGTGKSTTAICFCKDFLKNKFKENFLELNASNERGIDTIRSVVFDFARHKPYGTKFKILLLDEADYLTIEAQAALRRLMENYPTTKFILTCNYHQRIEPAIKSRCKKFEFKKLTNIELEIVIDQITLKNQINLTNEHKQILINNAKGDLRYILNNITSVTNVVKNTTSIKEIVNNFLKYIKQKNNFNEIKEEIDKVLNAYIDIKNIIEIIFEDIWTSTLEINTKLKIIQLLSNLEEKLYFGCNPSISFIHFASLLKNIYSELN